jgi:Spy/CpxP family protein refolding chaperone
MIFFTIILLTPAVFGQNQNRSTQGSGQGQRGFDPEQMIERRIQSLDRELNLTPDQEKKIRAIMEKAFKNPPPREGAPSQDRSASSRRDRLTQDRNTSNPMSQLNTEIKKVLTPDQAKKYDALPQPGRGFGQGGRGFSVDERVKTITERLKLTADQQKKIRALYEKQNEEMRKMFEQMSQGGDREAMGETMRKQREKNEKDIEALLTADQKKAYAAWRQEMTQQRQRGGNRDQRGGNNGQR